LRISSFKVSGSVKAEEKDGFKFATAKLVNKKTNLSLLTNVSSDYTFVFPHVSCGDYAATVIYQNEGITYSVLPQSADFAVTDGIVGWMIFLFFFVLFDCLVYLLMFVYLFIYFDNLFAYY
jgi:hypothetical protein